MNIENAIRIVKQEIEIHKVSAECYEESGNNGMVYVERQTIDAFETLIREVGKNMSYSEAADIVRTQIYANRLSEKHGKEKAIKDRYGYIADALEIVLNRAERAEALETVLKGDKNNGT